MNKRLLVDFDGCITDTSSRIRYYAKKHFGLNVDYIQSEAEDYFIENVFEITIPQVIQMFSDGEFYSHVKPFPGALDALERLDQAGYEIHIVTARPHTNTVREDTLIWLGKHHVPLHSVHIVDKAKEKPRIASAFGADIFIEDSPVNAAELVEVCRYGFVLDAPYMHNKYGYVGNRSEIILVKSLSEVADILTVGNKRIQDKILDAIIAREK